MATLAPMPPVRVAATDLALFGAQWNANGRKLSRTAPNSSGQLGFLFDRALGQALAVMLGGIPVVNAANGLLPPQADCVEVGPFKVVGGVRVQNYDVGYRPDGVRFLADSKTLNDRDSVGKNSLNMVNDLATEATTAHLRFPYAVVAFVVAFPEPCIDDWRRVVMTETLERMTGRVGVSDPVHQAEAIAFVLWDPDTGAVNPAIPAADSPLRLERLSEQIEATYHERYKGDPPHR